MTINQLHKITADLVAKGAGRRGVAIDKSTFTHPLESDGVAILNAETADMECIDLSDDDGGTATRKDGSTKSVVLLVIRGGGK